MAYLRARVANHRSRFANHRRSELTKHPSQRNPALTRVRYGRTRSSNTTGDTRMIERRAGLRRFGCALAITLTSAFNVGGAWAQATPDPAAPPPPPPAAPPPAAEPLPPPPPVAPPAAVATTPAPTAAEAMPATRPDVLPPIDVGAWTRVGSVFQKQSDPSSLGDWHMDNAYVELHAGGKIHKKVGVTLNLNANMTSGAVGSSTTARPRRPRSSRSWTPSSRSTFRTSSTSGPATCWFLSTAPTPPVRSS